MTDYFLMTGFIFLGAVTAVLGGSYQPLSRLKNFFMWPWACYMILEAAHMSYRQGWSLLTGVLFLIIHAGPTFSVAWMLMHFPSQERPE